MMLAASAEPAGTGGYLRYPSPARSSETTAVDGANTPGWRSIGVMDTTVEQRRHPRREIVGAVMIAPNGDQHDAMVLDLSEGGVRVDLPDDWLPSDGAALRVFFVFDGYQAIMLESHVTRIAVDHMGLEFEPAQEDRIRHLLDVAGIPH